MFSCQKMVVFAQLICLYILFSTYLRAPTLLLLICFYLHHLHICQHFCLPLDHLFHLYHWLLCWFLCWCLLLHLWSRWRCYCLIQVELLIILHYCHILCLLYMWCRSCLKCHLFQVFNLNIFIFPIKPLFLIMRISSSIISCPGNYSKMWCLFYIVVWSL